MSKLSLKSTIENLINTHVYEVKEDNLVADPLVTACILTYNHRNFIEEAIQGVLLQQTNFSFEILISDDCSTDGTTEIIKEYQLNYPNKIRLLLTNKNLFRPLPNIEFGLMGIALLQSCRGKYIALCEGDDYWTDPLKLQKQVDFLEANPEYSGTAHFTQLLEADGTWATGENWWKYARDQLLGLETNLDITFEYLSLDFYPFHTSSFCFKTTHLPSSYVDWLYFSCGDVPLYLTVASNGNIFIIPEYMSVYRKNYGSITYTPTHEVGSLILNLHRIYLFSYFKYTFYPRGEAGFSRKIQDSVIVAIYYLLGKTNKKDILAHWKTFIKFVIERPTLTTIILTYNIVNSLFQELNQYCLFRLKLLIPSKIKNYLKTFG